MRKLVVASAVVVALVVGGGGAVGATSPNAADRACQGAVASEGAQTEHPVGTVVRDLASPEFGRFVGSVASTCNLP